MSGNEVLNRDEVIKLRRIVCTVVTSKQKTWELSGHVATIAEKMHLVKTLWKKLYSLCYG
jgi:hypothetical protein